MSYFIWGKAYNLEVGGEETSSFLMAVRHGSYVLGCRCGPTRPKRAGNYVLLLARNIGIDGVEFTSFFLERSPEAPIITRMVFSCISRGADILYRVKLVDARCNLFL